MEQILTGIFTREILKRVKKTLRRTKKIINFMVALCLITGVICIGIYYMYPVLTKSTLEGSTVQNIITTIENSLHN